MTDSVVAAAAKAQQGGAPASTTAGGEDPELHAFLAEADAAKAEMTAVRDELSRLQTVHEASKNAIIVGSGVGRTTTQAALVRLLGSARRLRAHLASIDRRAPALAAQAAAGLRWRVHDLTADVQALRCQASAERRDDAARRYLAVAGDAPTEEQLDWLLASTEDSDAAVRAALLSAAPAAAVVAEEQEEAAKEVAEVEHGLPVQCRMVANRGGDAAQEAAGADARREAGAVARGVAKQGGAGRAAAARGPGGRVAGVEKRPAFSEQ
ncbi:hypothetical protein BAE44_0002316 [Dichanthelium oligosanthes]|uniref:Syntaxin N-terminal domain-containing protein n=1 Tax=Dichanthelium oligosanthes TaxID=888268 RepID=A0A1E5WH41_9POAL|nr:hypothetical protein BAE44_0002316 [Dichanthelium oligosanthes]